MHIDITKVYTQAGKLLLFVAVDRANKFVSAKNFAEQTKLTTTAFLKSVISIIPYNIQIILMDNGNQCTNRKKINMHNSIHLAAYVKKIVCSTDLQNP